MNDYSDLAALRTNRTDGAGPRSGRVTLLSQVLVACVTGRPALPDMGIRALFLIGRIVPGVQVDVGRRELRRVCLESGTALHGVGLGEVSLEERQHVAELVLGGEREPRRVGRRVSLLAYAFERGDGVRSVLPSFEAIGALWGLKARNQRSAVCAAMDKTVRQMVEKGQLRSCDYEQMTELWFAKKRVTRERYHAAQIGNENRVPKAAPADDEDLSESASQAVKKEHAELIEGVPVKPEFKGLSALELRARLQRLHEAADLRRLGL
jgi:hypothetical protein